MSIRRKTISRFLESVDIQINGPRPWDIHTNNQDEVVRRVLNSGSIGFGETYMDGLWQANRLDQLFTKISSSGIMQKAQYSPRMFLQALKVKILNFQSKKKAKEVGEKHYDIGNDLYHLMLGPTMAYSCGYWEDAQTLNEAQEAKLDLICRKINLQPGMKVLDIGSGWGSFTHYAAEVFGAEVVGVTISEEQAKFAAERSKDFPVEIRLQDYRDIPEDESFDRIVSVGMFEHVGPKNYREYMKVARKHLKDGGLFLLHTIGSSYTTDRIDPWINKYIFPNAVIPSPKQIKEAAAGVLVIEDWHDFGHDYDKTLMAWHENVQEHWPDIEKLTDKHGNPYDQRFKKMWDYYLLSCAGTFRSGNNHLWQVVLSKGDLEREYQPVR